MAILENLSSAQKGVLDDNKSKLQEGQIFLIDIGEGGGQLAQFKDGSLNTLKFDFSLGFGGKTIGQNQNQVSNKAISDLGINRDNIIDLRNDANFLWRDVVADLPKNTTSDFNTFQGEFISPTRATNLKELPDLSDEQKKGLQQESQQTAQFLSQQETKTLNEVPISIPFKDGLSDSQKQGITNLSKKPVDQWTETDKKNWAFATNNAALPSQPTQPSVTQSKEIFQDGNDLFIQNQDGSFKRISDQSELENLVFQQGFQDTRRQLPTQQTTQQTTGDIPFKTGLSEAQKQSISNLAQKPADQWTDTDRRNWDFATNNAPLPTDQVAEPDITPEVDTTTTELQPEEANALDLLLQELIESDPFLSEQFEDEEMRAAFEGLPKELQGAYLQTLRALGERIEAGEVINPDIEITPEMAKEFLDQATSEIDPFFREQIGLVKSDLDLSFQRMQEDFETGVRRAEEPFKLGLAAQAETEAQRGLAFGSARGGREQRAITGQQELISDAGQDVARTQQDLLRSAERQIGSEELGGVQAPGVQQFGVSRSGFTPTGTRQLFTPQGGLVGSLGKQKEVDVRRRASELESAFRTTRNLNLNNL